MEDDCSDSTSVDLDAITSIVMSLQRVVADFYGPQCSQTLLTSQTGKAVVTSDGVCILEALQPSHPVALSIHEAIRSCHRVTLDGSKSFLLYLSYFLHQLQEEIHHGRFCCEGTNVNSNKHSIERQGVLYGRKSVQLLKQNVVPKLCDQLQLHSSNVVELMLQKMNKMDVIKHVLKTTLMPHYNPRLCELFADVLISSLPTSCSDSSSFIRSLQYQVDNFFNLTIKVSSQPYGGSAVADLLLLNRKFTLKCDSLLSLSEVAAVILKGSIDGCDTDEIKETYVTQNAGQIVNLLQKRRKRVELFADKLSINKICLLICTEGIPGYAAEVFQRHDISVIANVSNDDIELLEELTQKMSLNNISDCIEDCHIMKMLGIDELVIGGKPFVQLKLTDVVYPLKHLIVCAPTVGLCDQLGIAFQKALNALKMCFVQEKSQAKGVDEDGVTKREEDLAEKSEGREKHSVKLIKTIAEDLPEVEQLVDNKDGKEIYPDQKLEMFKVNKAVEEIIEIVDPDSDGDFIDKKHFTDIAKYSKGYQSTFELPKNVTFSIIEGGGCFEFLVAKLLKDFSHSCSDNNLLLICRVLERTMISVVKKLFDNTTVQPENKRKFMEVKTKLKEKLSVGELWGLNRRGVLSYLSQVGVVEPLMCKIHIMQCVLNLVDQLLSIDRIVSVKGGDN